MDLQEINKWLRRGDKRTVTKIARVEYDYVIKVLKGNHKNESIVEIARRIAQKNKERIENEISAL